MLAERDLLGTPAGRDAFAVLLFQDLVFIPLVAMVPLLGGAEVPDRVPWLEVARGAAAIAAILLGGRFLMRPAFRAIGGARTPEMFTTLALLIVVGAAALAGAAGLSPSLGAFLAGVLLSGSEYRHELQADIEPFEGLLLGFFFISVGMSAQLGLLAQHPLGILAMVAALLAVKIVVVFALGLLVRHRAASAARLAFALPQGSEFAFVLFAAAVGVGALSAPASEAATLVVALSMVATPLLFAAGEAALAALRRAAPPSYDRIEDDHAPVIIAGFGRVGQIVGRVLRMEGIRFTALERDPGQVDVVRRFGNKVYFGDPGRPDLLRAAGAERAKVLVVAIEDMAEGLKLVEMARRTFPDLLVVARARNRRHVYLLMDRGIGSIVRDTFHSSLRLAELVLQALHVPADSARRAVELFCRHDERVLSETHAIYRDEKALIQTTREAAAELASLFEADQPERPG
jgi:voltage-gated potassium channel Kch